MINSYDRTVKAALAETNSKFTLAEALALDIPHRQPGPAADAPVDVYLAQAQAAITEAGGEQRSVVTLKAYRLTALWVSSEVATNFRWITGRSYSAHDEARRAGMSYDEFAAMPKATVDTIRQQAGKAGTDGPISQQVAAMPLDQRAALADELLHDPAVALAVGVDADPLDRIDNRVNRDLRLAPDEVAEAMRDPGVAAHVTADPDANQAISQARHDRHMADVDRRLRDLDAKHPAAAETNRQIGKAGVGLDLDDAVTQWRAACRRFAETVARELPKASPYDAGADPWGLGANVAKAGPDAQLAANTLEALVSYVAGGESLEAELAKITGHDGNV